MLGAITYLLLSVLINRGETAGSSYMDVRIFEDERVDICQDLTATFISYREGPEMFRHSISLEQSSDIFRIEASGEVKHFPWMNVSELTQESAFFVEQERFVYEYIMNVFKAGRPVVFEYRCKFVPFECTVLQMMDGNTLTRYTVDKGVETLGSPPYSPDVSEDDIARYGRGSGISILRDNAALLQKRWTSFCRKIVAMDNPRHNEYSLYSNRGNGYVSCTMHTQVPLAYNISLANGVDIYKYMRMYSGGRLKVEAWLDLRDLNGSTDFEFVISSPTGWYATVKYSEYPRQSPGMLVSSIDGKFESSAVVSWHRGHGLKHAPPVSAEYSIFFMDVWSLIAIGVVFVIVFTYLVKLRVVWINRVWPRMRYRLVYINCRVW
uniref:M152 n=1 Tax=Murid herpesvirus 1 TaxID=10366 RepID=Q69G18_MUHV1|nr:m152 [Murid betaherpesvirus 1]